jgi:FdhD protein
MFTEARMNDSNGEVETPLPTATSLSVEGCVSDAGQMRKVAWQLPVETPVALRVNDEDLAVMLCTPQDLQDFARGFVLSEGLLPSAAAIQSMRIQSLSQGIRIDLRVQRSALAREALKQRRLAGRSGCGLCGVQSLEDALRPLPLLPQRPPPTADALIKAFQNLSGHQPIKDCNRSVHVAAWCDAQGEILLSREDVGRHNALDKLIGAVAAAALDLTTGFATVSSRCSFELVQKAVTVGIPALSSLSAPTALALQLAQQSGLHLSAKCDTGIITFTPGT